MCRNLLNRIGKGDGGGGGGCRGRETGIHLAMVSIFAMIKKRYFYDVSQPVLFQVVALIFLSKENGLLDFSRLSVEYLS